MTKGRLEAFSDGVFAIIITIMVLDLKVPHSPDIEALRPMLPIFLSYVLSFVYVGIYWNNHHHLLHASERVTGGILWANLHLLFWLSLAPFTTEWIGENPRSPTPRGCSRQGSEGLYQCNRVSRRDCARVCLALVIVRLICLGSGDVVAARPANRTRNSQREFPGRQ
jgi:hypothetical protein